MPEPTIDPRPGRTQAAIVGAFNALVLDQPYDRLSVERIAAGAGVGRSTFYNHFRGKDEVLARALAPLLDILAAAAAGEGDAPRVRMLLEHFAENRRRARAFLAGPSSEPVLRALADVIESRIAGMTERPTIPAALVAAEAADAQLGLVRAWLEQTHPCPAADVASALIESSRAVVRAGLGVSSSGRP